MDTRAINAENRLHAVAGRIFKKEKKLPVIAVDTDEWAAWLVWRRQNGLGTSFMEERGRWTVPTWYPGSELDESSLLENQSVERKLLT
jgi:hypothetical protein|tara:strand:- start:717 stop:980 length:264 start_codon:yes stop_codon:yes gene_type:complete